MTRKNKMKLAKTEYRDLCMCILDKTANEPAEFEGILKPGRPFFPNSFNFDNLLCIKKGWI